ncbi:MAG: YfiR/HmsC family protein [Candidatus Poribacteria bacterium]|nr:YfiR/HmsC family protein [Candidatus Poribacteria bacterium]
MNRRLSITTLKVAFLFIFIIGNTQLYAASKDAPPKIVAVLIVKLIAFDKKIGGSAKDLTIYVMGAPNVAKALEKGIGKKIGKATLKNVVQGDGLPENKPDVFYVGDASKVDEASNYTRSNKVLSVTGIVELIPKGISLGMGVGDDGKPKILLNLTAAKSEGIDWNPAILKVASEVIK